MFHLTLQAMQSFIIKSHKPSTLYMGEVIFILNKGMNSGKPLYEPCPNCFVLVFPTADAKESYYWLAYSLWKAKFWHRFMVGSVISFLRINDFKNEFDGRTKIMMQEHEEHIKNVKALKLLEAKESQFNKNLALISEMRRAILHSYITKY